MTTGTQLSSETMRARADDLRCQARQRQAVPADHTSEVDVLPELSVKPVAGATWGFMEPQTLVKYFIGLTSPMPCSQPHSL